MAPFHGVIFDLDGTLVDSLHDIGASMNCALEELGLPTHPLESYRDFVGAGVRVLAERAIAPRDHHQIDASVAAFRRHYDERLVDHTRPYPGIVELLSELGRCAIPTAIFSNKYDEATVRIVASIFSATSFAAVRGHREPAPKKPDPAVALELAQIIEVEPAGCVFVGDTGIDMKTASAAGMLPVGVRWGFRGASELIEAGARVLLDAPADLLSVTLP